MADDYQRYGFQPSYNNQSDVENINSMLDLYDYLITFRDGNVSTDDSSVATASSFPHAPYADVQYPPVVSQVPLINISPADPGIDHSFPTSVDPTMITYAPPQPASQHMPVGIINTPEWEVYIDSVLYPTQPVLPPSPTVMPSYQPTTTTTTSVSGPIPDPQRQTNSPKSGTQGRSVGPHRLGRQRESSRTMSPAQAARQIKDKSTKESNHPACMNCKKGKIKCRPSASGDHCATCLAQKRTCIPSDPTSRQPQQTVGFLEKKIRELFAKIQGQMVALNGGGASFHGPSSALVPEGKTCDCPEGMHKPGCRVADPGTLCMRARLMDLRSPDEDDDENENQDADMGGSGGGSESDGHLSSSSLSLITPVPPSGTPFGMFFELAHQLGSPVSEHAPKGSPSATPIGLANADYFTPGPAAHPEIRRIMIEQGKLPSYLIQKELSPQDCVELFDQFMKYWNVSVSVLDPKLHTPKYVLARCPFLFTVVLAVAARNHKNKDFYPLLMKEARNLAGEACFEGWKSVEKVQALILLTTFPAPARRHDEERTWMYLGCAIRMAMDLDLNRAADGAFANERAEREYLNRVRTWLICHNLEVSCGAKTGKPITMQEDEMISNSKTWWNSSVYNMQYDVHLCAFTQICMIFHKYQRKIVPDTNGREPYITDVLELARQFTQEIEDFQAYFERLFIEESPQEDEACRYRAHVRYTAHYFRLVIYSHCYRRSSVQGIQPGDPILRLCIDAATQLVKALTDHHAHSKYFKYSAEGWFTFGAFAGAFMIKLLCPQAAPVIDRAEHDNLRALVVQLINAYSSKDVAIDERHTPSIYARFLSHLLSRADELNGGLGEVVQAPKPEMDELFSLPLLHTLTHEAV